jgi:hypothetical protein
MAIHKIRFLEWAEVQARKLEAGEWAEVLAGTPEDSAEVGRLAVEAEVEKPAVEAEVGGPAVEAVAPRAAG